jgi:hypothetical protein
MLNDSLLSPTHSRCSEEWHFEIFKTCLLISRFHELKNENVQIFGLVLGNAASFCVVIFFGERNRSQRKIRRENMDFFRKILFHTTTTIE